MTRGPKLSPRKRFVITKYKRQGWTQKRISKLLEQPASLISTYLRDPQAYGQHKPTGRPPKASDRLIRLIRRFASQGNMLAKEIKTATSAPITVRQVQRIISALPHLQYKKQLHTPKLTPTHKD